MMFKHCLFSNPTNLIIIVHFPVYSISAIAASSLYTGEQVENLTSHINDEQNKNLSANTNKLVNFHAL